MAEWLKAAVLKTAGRKTREFESLSLRQLWGLARVRMGCRSALGYDRLEAVF
jgi:hypothetical protein